MSGKSEERAGGQLAVVAGYCTTPFADVSDDSTQRRGLGTVVYFSRENMAYYKRGDIVDIGIRTGSISSVSISDGGKEFKSVPDWMDEAPFVNVDGQRVCNNCLEAPAILNCVDCKEDFCRDCSGKIHKGRKRAEHSLSIFE